MRTVEWKEAFETKKGIRPETVYTAWILIKNTRIQKTEKRKERKKKDMCALWDTSGGSLKDTK